MQSSEPSRRMRVRVAERIRSDQRLTETVQVEKREERPRRAKSLEEIHDLMREGEKR